MTPSQTAELLGLVQAFDRRTVGEADIMAWHVILTDVDFDHAKAAVLEHFGDSKEWLMPSDIKASIAKKRKRVIEGIPPVEPPWQLADLPEDENRWRANYIHAIADGLTPDTARTKANYLAGITDDPEPLAIEAVDVERALDEFKDAFTKSKRSPYARGPIQRTPTMWAADRGLQILDPDGWRQAGKDFRAPCTEAEFDEMLPLCTVGPFERRTEEIPMPSTVDGAAAAREEGGDEDEDEEIAG